MDQDNALIFSEGAPEGPEDDWFERLGTHIADLLHEAGVPYCRGGVMAKNPQWRGSRAPPRARLGEWVFRSRAPGPLLGGLFLYHPPGVRAAGPLPAPSPP